MSSSRLKSFFVLPFAVFQLLCFAGSLLLWGLQSFHLPWLGAALPAASFLVFLGYIARGGTARTSPFALPMLGASTLGLVIALSHLLSSIPDVRNPIPLAALSTLGNFLYIFWYSKLGRNVNSALEPGKPLPPFDLQDLAGKSIASELFLGKPTIFLFYRGNWCPLCVAQIREVSELYQHLANRGAEVALISPQPEEMSRELATRFDVPLKFFVDRDNRAAQELGIAHRNGLPFGMGRMGYAQDTVFPTLIITDAGGTIRFSDLTDNYRVRPEPETFLRVLDQFDPPPASSSS